MKIQIILLLPLFFLSIISCSRNESSSSTLYKIKDDLGDEIIFEKHPVRIISLAPNITEALYAIGADSLVVGVTDFCDYPPAAKMKPSTGSYLSPDYEKMLSLKPDLIIMSIENKSNPAYQALKNMGMKIFVSNAKNFDGILLMVKQFGIITGKKEQSDSLEKYLSSGRKMYLSAISKVTDTVFIIVSVSPLMTTNGKTFINDILQMAGVRNIYDSLSIEYPEVSYEDVTKKNPGYILLPTDTNDTKKSQRFIEQISRQLENVRAVKEKNFILIDDDLMFRPGPRVLDAAGILKRKLGELREQGE